MQGIMHDLRAPDSQLPFDIGNPRVFNNGHDSRRVGNQALADILQLGPYWRAPDPARQSTQRTTRRRRPPSHRASQQRDHAADNTSGEKTFVGAMLRICDSRLAVGLFHDNVHVLYPDESLLFGLFQIVHCLGAAVRGWKRGYCEFNWAIVHSQSLSMMKVIMSSSFRRKLSHPRRLRHWTLGVGGRRFPIA